MLIKKKKKKIESQSLRRLSALQKGAEHQAPGGESQQTETCLNLTQPECTLGKAALLILCLSHVTFHPAAAEANGHDTAYCRAGEAL